MIKDVYSLQLLLAFPEANLNSLLIFLYGFFGRPPRPIHFVDLSGIIEWPSFSSDHVTRNGLAATTNKGVQSIQSLSGSRFLISQKTNILKPYMAGADVLST